MRTRRAKGLRLGLAGGIALLVALVAGACGSGAGRGAAADGQMRVVATTTVLADLVRQVGGDRVSVESLVPKGGEVHTFDPKPSDIRRVTEARLVVRNGLGLDDWLAQLVADAGSDARVVALGEGLDGVRLIAGDGHEGEVVNPHLWLDVGNAQRYAARIAQELTAADPAGADVYAANLDAYTARLAELDAYARGRLGAIPEADRTVVSFHDAFPYFAAAYGLTIDGTIVDAPGQDPSAGEIADLVAAIRAKGVHAIFAEAQFNDELARTIGAETGATVVSTLYTDSVGDPPHDTYESMMRWNIDEVAGALGG